jgi:hypothetical protein
VNSVGFHSLGYVVRGKLLSPVVTLAPRIRYAAVGFFFLPSRKKPPVISYRRAQTTFVDSVRVCLHVHLNVIKRTFIDGSTMSNIYIYHQPNGPAYPVNNSLGQAEETFLWCECRHYARRSALAGRLVRCELTLLTADDNYCPSLTNAIKKRNLISSLNARFHLTFGRLRRR